MKRIFAILMAVLTIATLSLTTAFAKPAKSYSGKSLVILGDSISAGFGLANVPEDTLAQGLAMPHGEWVEGSWSQIVRDAKGFDKATSVNLSRSMWGTTEFLRLLDPAFESDLCEPENAYDMYISSLMMAPTELTKPGDATSLAASIKDAIRQADVLVMEIGSNDLFTRPLLEEFVLPFYQVFGRQAAVAVSIATQKQIKTLDTPEEVTKFLLGTTDLKEFKQQAKANEKLWEGRYDRILDIVYKLNPDVKVYSFGMTRAFQNMELLPGVDWTYLEEVNEAGIQDMRNWIKNGSKYRNKTTFVEMSNVAGYPFDYVLWPMFTYDMILDIHPPLAEHKKMAQNFLKVL